MVLLVLTSCGMKDRKQTYPRDEGVTQQQEQAGGQSEKNMRPREQNRGCPGNRQRGAGKCRGCREGRGRRKCQRCRECRNGRGVPGLPEMPHQPEARDRKGRELLSGQYKTWEPVISLYQAGSLRRGHTVRSVL